MGSDAVQKGTPVTWLFGIIVLLVYLGSYVWSIQEQNQHLTEVTKNQQEIINNQEEEIRQLEELVETMFEYMGVNSRSGINSRPYSPGTDPLYRKPI